MKLDPMLALFNLGGGEIILILSGALLIFGGKKLPELARGLGNGIREFKKATGNVSEQMRQAIEDPMPAPSRRSTPIPAPADRITLQASPDLKSLPAPTPDLARAAVITDIKF